MTVGKKGVIFLIVVLVLVAWLVFNFGGALIGMTTSILGLVILLVIIGLILYLFAKKRSGSKRKNTLIV